jgi:hypothetical protein
MQRVTVPSKYQIVIPKEIRESLKIGPVPHRSLKEMEGVLAGIPNLPRFERDPEPGIVTVVDTSGRIE